MQPRFTEIYKNDWYENIQIKEEGNKYFLTMNNKKLLNEDTQPFFSKSKKGAKGKIKEVLDELSKGSIIYLIPFNHNKIDSNNYDKCRIIKFAIPESTEPKQNLSSGLAMKLYYIKKDIFYNDHYPAKNGKKPEGLNKKTITVNQSGFIICPSCEFPHPFFINFGQGLVECIYCSALITAKEKIENT